VMEGRGVCFPGAWEIGVGGTAIVREVDGRIWEGEAAGRLLVDSANGEILGVDRVGIWGLVVV
jgi:hypothetical protein